MLFNLIFVGTKSFKHIMIFSIICIWLVVKMLVPGLGLNTSFPLGPAS